MDKLSSYEYDFYAWLQRQSERITLKKWNSVDATNLVEELESLGRKERQELRNWLGILLGHLFISQIFWKLTSLGLKRKLNQNALRDRQQLQRTYGHRKQQHPAAGQPNRYAHREYAHAAPSL